MNIKKAVILFVATGLAACSKPPELAEMCCIPKVMHLWPPGEHDSVKYRGRIFYECEKTELAYEDFYATKNDKKKKSVLIGSAKDTIKVEGATNLLILRFSSEAEACRVEKEFLENLQHQKEQRKMKPTVNPGYKSI